MINKKSIAISSIFSALAVLPSNAAITVNDCSGSIPNGKCLSPATSYKVRIHQVNICPKDPIPSGSSSPDFSDCITLFKASGSPYTGDVASGKSFSLPKEGMDKVANAGTYTHISLVFGNVISSSGTYSSGGTTWRTLNTSSAPWVSTSAGAAELNDQVGSNWRGSGDNDNSYCENNGGTQSRCELNYNGTQITAVFADSNLNATSGSSVSRAIYVAELSNSIKITGSSKGSFRVACDADLEVVGDGVQVTDMFGNPFIFSASFE